VCAALVVNGGLRIPATASVATCTQALRGTLRPTFAAAGSADSLVVRVAAGRHGKLQVLTAEQVCAKNSSDVYAWQEVSYSSLVSRFVTDLTVAAGETIR
jgi:hypothetical protein